VAQPWASADIFPGESKNFPGGARTYFLSKKQQERYFSQKSLKTYYFAPPLHGHSQIILNDNQKDTNDSLSSLKMLEQVGQFN
jgi:hypothetical protein